MSADLDIATTTTHLTLAQRVSGQADELLREQTDPAARHEMLATLQARRAWRGEQTLAIIAEDDDHELLTVHGEILISTDDLAREGVRAVVSDHELSVVGHDLVTVLQAGGDASPALDALRAAGASATLHHVTLLGGIVKPYGMAGPVATEGLGSFPAYQAARTR